MAIIKYRVEATVTRRTDENEDDRIIGSIWQYEEVENPHKQGKILTRDQAKKIIEEKGLVEVCNNRYGIIWDKPDEPMLNRYGGTFN